MVALEITTAKGTGWACGVAVAQGGMVVTTLDSVTGARTLTAMTSAGVRAQARVVHTDQGADIALVQVSANLPVARFADGEAMATGSAATIMALTARRGVTRVGGCHVDPQLGHLGHLPGGRW